jgi:hypothetical protein
MTLTGNMKALTITKSERLRPLLPKATLITEGAFSVGFFSCVRGLIQMRELLWAALIESLCQCKCGRYRLQVHSPHSTQP